MMHKKMAGPAGLAGLALLIGIPGSANAQLVTNGDFEATTHGGGQMGFNTNATGWATTGYNFIFTPGSADTTGETGQSGNVQMWGPNNGSANGLPATSPNGGNFVAADGGVSVGAITQTIHGLKVGDTYQLSFDWAAAQQYGHSGATTEKWTAKLGNQEFSTPIQSIASHGFSGWQTQTFDYKATSTSEVLSFLATGAPTGVPP